MPIKKRPSISEFFLYFLKLGTTGFGGPVALANFMQRDLTVERAWFSEEEFKEGLAFAQLSPGPLAAQLAMYLGWLRGGWWMSTLTAIAFILPSFIMVLLLAMIYVRYGESHWIQALFYSIGAAVIGIIAKSAYQLTKRTISKDILLWLIFLASAFVTIWTESELVWLFVFFGFLSLFIKAPPQWSRRTAAVIPLNILTGLKGPASMSTLAKLGVYFAKVGTIVFGSGLAIVPFLYGGVVQKFHWLNEAQFLDSVAVGMITPGPVVITSGFMGYLIGGIVGSIVAALGVFLPCYLFVIILAPLYRRFTGNVSVRAFVSGITAAAIGGIAGSVVVLGKQAIVDRTTFLIALFTFILLMITKKIPEPAYVIGSGLIGLVLKFHLWSFLA